MPADMPVRQSAKQRGKVGMMRIRYLLIPVIAALMLTGAGCGPKIPPAVTEKVSWEGDFKTLQADPEAYAGEFVILGGEILQTENDPDYSEITVLQYPTDTSGRPRPDENSGGRFLIRADRFLDPEVYKTGKLITVAGRITGAVTRPIGDYPYEYPVLKGELWVWERGKDGSPRFHFGLGLGTTF